MRPDLSRPRHGADSALLALYARRAVPRYTSYPTAVQFQPEFPGTTADQWLATLSPEATLSVYVHIPFCRQLCWYCGCHTAVTRSNARIARYGAALEREAAMVAAGSSGNRSSVTSSGAMAETHDVSIVAPWSTATGQSVPRPVPRTALSSR